MDSSDATRLIEADHQFSLADGLREDAKMLAKHWSADDHLIKKLECRARQLENRARGTISNLVASFEATNGR